MSALRGHLAHNYMRAACCVAALLIVAAFVFDIAPLALLAALFCGAMMIGMVWMMFGMAGKARH